MNYLTHFSLVTWYCSFGARPWPHIYQKLNREPTLISVTIRSVNLTKCELSHVFGFLKWCILASYYCPYSFKALFILVYPVAFCLHSDLLCLLLIVVFTIWLFLPSVTRSLTRDPLLYTLTDLFKGKYLTFLQRTHQ